MGLHYECSARGDQKKTQDPQELKSSVSVSPLTWVLRLKSGPLQERLGSSAGAECALNCRASTPVPGWFNFKRTQKEILQSCVLQQGC